MSNTKHFHFKSGEKIPKSPYSLVRKSTDKPNVAQHHRFTISDCDYFGRKVHTENNDTENYQIDRDLKKIRLNENSNDKFSSNFRMSDKDYKLYEQLYQQKKQKKTEGFTFQIPKSGITIAANNLHQNISIYTQGKYKKEPKVLVTEPGFGMNSKDKFIKKDNKKLFDRLLVVKDKNVIDDLLKSHKTKQNKDQLHFGNSESKQNKQLTQSNTRNKSQSIEFKQKLQMYGISDIKRDKLVMPQTENTKPNNKILNTQPCELKKPQIQILEKIGEGTFGEVYKAKMGNKIVAVKKVFQDKKYKNRELQILNMIQNDFVLHVLDTYHTRQKGTKGEPAKDYLNVVMEFYQQNLFQANSEPQEALSPIEIKLFIYQLFRGLMYIHSLDICHRDIKPQNLLVNRKNARLVICDFGSAKKLIKGEENIAYICSRCYRAPELIFGCTNYNPMIDIWSAGCVLLELLTGEPFFIGDSNIGQLVQIIKVLGTPSKTEVINMNPSYDLDDYKFPKIKTKPWKQIFPKIDQNLESFLKQIMIYSPKERLNAAEALCHQYFDELREEPTYKQLREKKEIFPLFDFTRQELRGNEHLIPKLIPEWHPDSQLQSF